MSNEALDPTTAANGGQTPAFALPPTDRLAAESNGFSLPPDLLAGLLADGDEQLVAWTLRNAIAERGRVAAYDELLSSAMALIGERWAKGEWGIAEEHLATQTIARALDTVRPEPHVDERAAPLAVLAGVTGEHHMIGLICLAHILDEAGWATANLGADIPGHDIARFASRQGASLIAISASLEERLPAIRDSVAAIRGAIPGVPVILGGRAAAAIAAKSGLDLAWAGTSLSGVVPVLEELRRGVSAPS